MLCPRNALRWMSGPAVLCVLGTLVIGGCGSPEGTQGAAVETGAEAPAAGAERAAGEMSVILRADRFYTLDDPVAAGWKRSKQFSTETLPHAQEVWYGFFNRKDVEIRVYASHRDALEHGVQPAEEAVGRVGAQRGGWNLLDFGGASIAKYQAYAVVGNLVMLCETELAVCRDLIARME